MDSKTLNKVLLMVIVMLLVLGVGIAVWALTQKPRYDTPIEVTKLPVPAESSEQTRKLLASFDSALQALARSQAERDQRLLDAIATAKDEGKGAETARLEGELRRQRTDWDHYKQELDTWSKEWKESVAKEPDSGSEPPSPPPPPLPPSPGQEETRGTGSGGAKNDDFAKFADTVALGVCIAKPPLCKVVIAIAQFLKGLSGQQREEVIRLAAAIAVGKGAPPEVVNAAADVLKGNPEARDKIFDLAEQATRTPEGKEILEDLQRHLEEGAPPELKTIADRVVEMASQGRECRDLVEILSRRGEGFASEGQQDLIRGRLINQPLAVYEQAWTRCLAGVGVVGRSDAAAEAAP